MTEKEGSYQGEKLAAKIGEMGQPNREKDGCKQKEKEGNQQ